MSLVWAPDLARVARGFALAEWTTESESPIYHVTDGRETTYREVITALCDHLGKKPPRISTSASMGPRSK